MVDQVVQGRIGRGDLRATLPALQILRVVARGGGKAGFGQITRTQRGDLRIVLGRPEREAVYVCRIGIQRQPILQRGGRVLVVRIAVAQLLGLDGRGRMQAALAFEGHLLRVPGHRRLLMQQEGAVLEIALTEIVVHLLVRRHATADDAAQRRLVSAALMHPRHVADREVGIQAEPARTPGLVMHAAFPQLHCIVGGQRHAQFHNDAVVTHPPAHIVLARGKRELLRRCAHRFVRHRIQRAGVFVLEIEEAPGMMRVVRLLGHHEVACFQQRRMRVLGRLRLHELPGGITTAGQL